MTVAAADPEVAAATLAADLDALWASGRPDAAGWKRFALDPLRWIVVMPAETPTGEHTHFFVLLDGRAYDLWPVDVQFVDPSDWQPASAGRWWPQADPAVPAPRQQWFGLHATFDYQDGAMPRPLVCFSFTLGYYESNHAPAEAERWRQGRHTVAATLHRLAEILSPAHFRGASG